jgi:hypothetical protein
VRAGRTAYGVTKKPIPRAAYADLGALLNG